MYKKDHPGGMIELSVIRVHHTPVERMIKPN